MLDKWTTFHLGLAQYVSTASKDPSTRVGAVIVRPDQTVVSVGFNGFPRGIEDNPKLLNDREAKYSRILHAEENAILFSREPLTGCTLYTWPFLTCTHCALLVIQKGVRKVVAPKSNNPRWDFSTTRSLYREAGIVCEEIEVDTTKRLSLAGYAPI